MWYIIGGILIVLFLLICTAYEKFGWMTGFICVTLLYLYWYVELELIQFIKLYGLNLLLGFAIYILIGIMWSFVKWLFFAKQYKKEYLILPKAKDHKGKIIGYISYWPLSIMTTVLDLMFNNIFKEIYEHISGVYDKLTDKFIGDE